MEQKSTSKFPNISRKITESNIFRKLNIGLVIIICLLLLLLLGIYSLELFAHIQTREKLLAQKEQLVSKLNTWQSIAEKYSNYKEAYFQIAILEYKLGDIVKAEEYLAKTLLLDPNYEQAQNLRKLLDSK